VRDVLQRLEWHPLRLLKKVFKDKAMDSIGTGICA
jgi:hypothetical protein